MTIVATNDNVWVIRYKSDGVVEGITIPDSAQKPTHKGIIISSGELVSDKSIKEGRTAVFNKSAGFEISEDGITYVILRQMDIIGTDEYKNEIYE